MPAKSSSSRSSSRTSKGRKSKTTTDHKEIRRWAEARDGTPSCVRGTGNKRDQGVLRFDFPGYSGEQTLEHISWKDFFEKFDQQNLALLYQEKTSTGKPSNFNKLVSRSDSDRRRSSSSRASHGRGAR